MIRWTIKEHLIWANAAYDVIRAQSLVDSRRLDLNRLVVLAASDRANLPVFVNGTISNLLQIVTIFNCQCLAADFLPTPHIDFDFCSDRTFTVMSEFELYIRLVVTARNLEGGNLNLYD